DLHECQPDLHFQLDVQERAPADGTEDLGQSWDAEPGQGPSAERVDMVRATMKAFEGGVMADDRHAVGRRTHVEFEPVATWQRQGGPECRQAVLRRDPPVASMGETKRPDWHLSDLEPSGDPEVV